MTKARLAAWALAGAGLPVLCAAAVLLTEVDRSRWLALSPALLRGVTSDAFTLEVTLVALLAPLAGVAMLSAAARRPLLPASLVVARRQLLSAAAPLMLALAAGVSVSAMAAALGWRLLPDSTALVAMSHATLASAALALAGLGAVAAGALRDPLDAAAASVTAALVLSGGLLVAGPTAGDLPTPLVNVALIASPLVGTTSAAHLDLLRSDVFYDLSPVAHRRFDYPDWRAASALYLAVALCCGAWTVRHLRWRAR